MYLGLPLAHPRRRPPQRKRRDCRPGESSFRRPRPSRYLRSALLSVQPREQAAFPCRRPNTRKTPATPRPLQTGGWLQPSGRGPSFCFRPVIRDALSLALLHHIPYKVGSHVGLCQNFSSVHTTSNTAGQGWVAWRRFLGRETPSRPPGRRAAWWGGEQVRRYDLAGDSMPVGCRRRRECRNCGPCGNSDQGHQGGYGKPWSESHVGASCPGWCEPLLFVQCRLSTP